MSQNDIERKRTCKHPFCLRDGGCYLLYIVRKHPEMVENIFKDKRFGGCNRLDEVQAAIDKAKTNKDPIKDKHPSQ